MSTPGERASRPPTGPPAKPPTGPPVKPPIGPPVRPPTGPPDKPRPVKPPTGGELDAACREHLEFVRKNCPGLLQTGPVGPGKPLDPLPVDPKSATTLLVAAAKDAAAADAGRRPADESPRAVVWTDGTDALLVVLDTLTVATADGVVSIGVDVACDQLRAETGEPRARIEVDIVLGTPERPAGLLAAAPPPRGPAVVVDRWHDALIALAWQALLDTAAGLSAAAGSDPDGAPLIPSRWTATRDGLTIGPQARHPFDRSPATATSRRRGAPG